MSKKRAKAAPPMNPGVFESLRSLLEELDRPAPARKRGPGRPGKTRAETAPVVLHLYRSQIDWLDDYAADIQSRHDGNVKLSRVEIVRGLLLGLARHALEHDLAFPSDMPIRSERDLQYALARSLAS